MDKKIKQWVWEIKQRVKIIWTLTGLPPGYLVPKLLPQLKRYKGLANCRSRIKNRDQDKGGKMTPWVEIQKLTRAIQLSTREIW